VQDDPRSARNAAQLRSGFPEILAPACGSEIIGNSSDHETVTSCLENFRAPIGDYSWSGQRIHPAFLVHQLFRMLTIFGAEARQQVCRWRQFGTVAVMIAAAYGQQSGKHVGPLLDREHAVKRCLAAEHVEEVTGNADQIVVGGLLPRPCKPLSIEVQVGEVENFHSLESAQLKRPSSLQ